MSNPDPGIDLLERAFLARGQASAREAAECAIATLRAAGWRDGEELRALAVARGAAGGHARAAKLTPEERSQSARRAALARFPPPPRRA